MHGSDFSTEAARAPRLRGAPAPIRSLRGYGSFLVDLDGTLMQAGELAPGAARFLRRHGARSIIVSNNSADDAAIVADRLAASGAALDCSRILLAGEMAVRCLAERFPGAQAMIIGSENLQDLAERAGFRRQARSPDLVLVGRDESFDYRRLAAAANAVRGGAKLFATNPDLSHPGRGETLVPETGALLAAIGAAAGRGAECVFGKPDPAMLLEGLRRLGGEPESALVIGDNPLTDGAGAARAGLACAIVGPATSLNLDDLMDAPP